jgi:hypothetical protein
LTQSGFRSVRYELVDINGTVVSVHHTALDAAKEAERLWPGQPQDELGGSAECRFGWDIQVVGS